MHVTSAQSRVLNSFFTTKLDTMQTFAFQRKRKKTVFEVETKHAVNTVKFCLPESVFMGPIVETPPNVNTVNVKRTLY